jgi:glycosyltransferase involved in cell wall biosynthesis
MQHVFLESHNIKNPFFGFGQFNYHLINGIYQLAPEDFKMSLHVKDTEKWKANFGEYYKLKKYFSVRRYPQARLRKKYDLWHAMNQNTKIEPFRNIPYLLTVHNITHIKDQEKYMEKEVHQRFQEKLNRSNAITYISNYAKTSTHEFFDVPDVPEYIIYNGNPIKDIQLSSIYKPSFVPQRPFLFSIGEFTKRKNFKTLIEMLRLLPDYNLVIAGKNTTAIAQELKELISKYHLEDRVRLPGKISELDKQWYFQNCRAFVFPSLREGFGLPIIEAMRFGKPVITSNNTSLPEIGRDIAYYWDHYDPEYMAKMVNESIANFDSSQTLNTSKSVAHAQSFNWKDAAQSYIDVYRNTLNS